VDATTNRDASNSTNREGSSGGGDAAATVSFKNDIAPILAMKCGSSCHGGEYNMAASAYTRLQANTTAMCGGGKRTTILVAKLSGMNLPCGGKMPQNCTGNACVPEADVAKIDAWVKAGAPNN
jgi:hypothetical protein